jgi:hypothetical protein
MSHCGPSRTSFLLILVCFFLFACAPEPLNRQSPAVESAAPPAAGAPRTGEPFYEGAHDVTNCDEIIGWAWDANNPGQPVQVEVYSDGKVVATAAADEFRQDLLDVGKGNGRHGFTMAVPDVLKDGARHSIRLKIRDSSFELWETPRELNCGR